MEHLSALRFNSRKLFVHSCCCQSRYIVCRAPSLIIYQMPKQKKGKKKTDQCEKIEHSTETRKKQHRIQSVRCAFALLCLFIPCGQTWTPYTRCWSRQARSVETQQTHHLRLPQQNTPPPVQHLRQRGPPPIPVPRPPLVRRTKKFLPTLERTSEPRKFSHELQWRITMRDIRLSRSQGEEARISHSRILLLDFILFALSLNRWILLNY